MWRISGNYLGSHLLGTPYLPDCQKLIRCGSLPLIHYILLFSAAKELGIGTKVSSLDSGYAVSFRPPIQQSLWLQKRKCFRKSSHVRFHALSR